jgi:hypothetical protein
MDKNLHNGEDYVGPPLNVCKCHRCDHHNHEVEDPVATENRKFFSSSPCAIREIRINVVSTHLVDKAFVGARILSGTISAG